jgi:outer membrane protein assembly factor BamB
MRRIYPAVVSGGRVYTLAPSAEVAASGADRFSVLQLVCLDGRTGRVLWRVGGIRGERLVDRLHFAGAPTVVGNSVFAVALSASPRIGESYCLVCLDAATGAPRYIADVSTQVDSKIAGVATTTLFPPAPPLVKSGTVFVATNAGAVAAFDALFGETLWVTRYDQTNGVTARSFESRFDRAAAREASFDFGPLFEEDGRLFVAPTESDRLLAVESRTGRLLWSFDNSARRFAYMLGARDRALYLSGDECAALDCATGRPLWPDAPDVPAFRGRGFIAGKFLVVPSLKALLYFNLSSGKLEDSVSLAGLAAGGAVDVSSYAGTLLWLEGRLAAVSNNRLTIFDTAAKDE